MWIDDQIIKQCSRPIVSETWIPESPMVVLGSSNNAEIEVNVAQCLANGIPILKRYGGGGTVVLYDGCLIISAGLWVKDLWNNAEYFRLLNHSVVDCLASEWPSCRTLSQEGHSDIVGGIKKLAGTSMFRSRHYLLYQASLLINIDCKLIETCLQHPSKEPEYRKQRSHDSFLIGLSDLVGPVEVERVRKLFVNFDQFIGLHLKEYLISPQEAEFKNLFNRVERNNR